MEPPVRLAEVDDLPALIGIEAAADDVLAEALGADGVGADALGRPTDGAERADSAGFILVAGRPPDGFVHVLDEGGSAHLEQLAVRPQRSRRGLGSSLLESACMAAARRGHSEITLTTFADVPFNRPFYARNGFTVVARPTGTLAAHLRSEEPLERLGRRVAMVRALTAPRSGEFRPV